MRRDPRKQDAGTLEVAQVMREFHHVFSRHLTGVQGAWNVDDLPIGDSAQDVQRRGQKVAPDEQKFRGHEHGESQQDDRCSKQERNREDEQGGKEDEMAEPKG